MATKTPKTTKQLLDKLSISLKNTLANIGRKNNSETQSNEHHHRDMKSVELGRESTYLTALMRIN